MTLFKLWHLAYLESQATKEAVATFQSKIVRRSLLALKRWFEK